MSCPRPGGNDRGQIIDSRQPSPIQEIGPRAVVIKFIKKARRGARKLNPGGKLSLRTFVFAF